MILSQAFGEIKRQDYFEFYCKESRFFASIDWEESNSSSIAYGQVAYRQKKKSFLSANNVGGYFQICMSTIPNQMRFFARVTIPSFIKNQSRNSKAFYDFDFIKETRSLEEIHDLATQAATKTFKEAIALEEAWRLELDEKISCSGKEASL